MSSHTKDLGSVIGPQGPQGATGPAGNDGVSPSVGVVQITGGHAVTITDAGGAHTFNVIDGVDGQPGPKGDTGSTGPEGPAGPKGDTGSAGHTPVLTSFKAEGVTTIYADSVQLAVIADGQDGEAGPAGPKGDPGDPGDPTELIDDTAGAGDTDVTFSADKLTADHSAVMNALSKSSENTNIAISAHQKHSLFWFNGSLHIALDDIAIGDAITTTGQTPNASEVTIDEALIKDIQIKGTSILQNGIANIPTGQSSLGVVCQAGMGVGVNSSGYLSLTKATDSAIKEGLMNYCAIEPSNQHLSTFYGLAKAAGNTDQSSSSNEVGTYTKDAKLKIQQMLGLWTPTYYTKKVLSADAASSESIYWSNSDNARLNIYEELVIVIYQSDRSTHNSEWGSGTFGYITIRDAVNNTYLTPPYSPNAYTNEKVPTILRYKRLPNCIIAEQSNGGDQKVGYLVRDTDYVDRITWIAVSANNATLYAGCTIEAYIHRFI